MSSKEGHLPESWACVTGRFQPVHTQHIELFSVAARNHDGLIIAITNPDVGARHEEASSTHRHLASANPFTYFERARLIHTATQELAAEVPIVIVPFNMTKPDTWINYVPLSAMHYVRKRGAWEDDKAVRLERAGYRVARVEPADEHDISATDIRQQLASTRATSITGLPPTVSPLLHRMLLEAPLTDRGLA